MTKAARQYRRRKFARRHWPKVVKAAKVVLIIGLLLLLLGRIAEPTNEPEVEESLRPTPTFVDPGKWITLPDGSQFRENICERFSVFETTVEKADGTTTNVILCPREKRNFEVFEATESAKIEPTPSPEPFYGPIKGKASYYTTEGCIGCRDDRKMANGDVLDDSALTVAYNRAPLNSYLEIRNEANGNSVIAKVTDRGGFERHGKIVDLSVATKNALGCGDVCNVMIYEIQENKEIAMSDIRP